MLGPELNDLGVDRAHLLKAVEAVGPHPVVVGEGQAGQVGLPSTSLVRALDAKDGPGGGGRAGGLLAPGQHEQPALVAAPSSRLGRSRALDRDQLEPTIRQTGKHTLILAARASAMCDTHRGGTDPPLVVPIRSSGSAPGGSAGPTLPAARRRCTRSSTIRSSGQASRVSRKASTAVPRSATSGMSPEWGVGREAHGL